MSGPPFPLPELLVTAGGKPVTGTRARVYWLLRLTAARRCYHPMDTQPPANGPLGWVPIHTLRAPWAGGSQGDRRVRDLQELYGVGYEVRRWSGLGGPPDSSATLYRLTSDPLAAINPLHGAEASLAAAAPAQRPAASPGAPGTTPSSPAFALLSRLRFWTHAGGRPEKAGTTLCVDPGSGSALAPPIELPAAFDRGELDSTQTDEAYRQHLLGAYHAGAFREISGLLTLVVWISPAAPAWSPLPALTRALVRLGARHEGEWRQEVA